MSAPSLPKWTRADYDRAADEYAARLKLENIMEATLQSRQRAISDASLALLRVRRPDVHPFGELLVQYFFEGNLRQVCPDNMVIKGNLEEKERTSYILEHELPIFWTMEYVSPNTRRKDYKENRQRYQDELKVPYYTIFDPERRNLVLLKLNGAYEDAPKNEQGRFLLAELDLEIGLLDGWLRYWYKGELLPIPVELARANDELRADLQKRDDQLRQSRDQLRQRDDQLRQRDDQLRQRDDQLAGVLAALRPLVESKAKLAGRHDILAALPSVSDGQQLSRWLVELG